ncbi:apolipoprotein A-II [Amphiprion ocellaris]|nr:apolipoprotein A-II [Amphiprion ocellaris]
MNAKYVFALILALQVSTSLCEIRDPSQELVDKYNEMKNTFKQRLINAYNKAKGVVETQVDGTEGGAAAKARVEELKNSEEFKALLEVLNNMYTEVSPSVDKARTAVLGAYEEHARPHIGEYLNNFIDVAKAYLDKVMPAQ